MVRTVSVRLQADVSDFATKMRGAGQYTRDLAGELDRTNSQGKLDKITKQASVVGVGLLGAAGVAVKFAADFDKQMSHVQAATHESAANMGLLRQASLDAGAATKFSATEAGKGVEELAKAGISTADILNGGLKGALSLAAAGEIGVGEAAETAASALTQFKLKGSDLPHVADLLAAGAGKAQGSVHDLGAALNMSGLVAAQMGLSVDDTVGSLAAFASAGLTGSDAGTSFKQALLSLAAPTQKSSALMASLGISAYDASGKFVGMAGLAGQLQNKLGGLTQQQRNSTLATIFGTDAIRVASVLYDQGATGVQGWIDKTNDAGYAAKTASINTDNLSGDVERLTGSLQTLAIQSGSGANQGLRILTKAAGGLVDQFSALPPAVGATMVILAGLGGVLTFGAVGFLKLRASIAATAIQLETVGPAGARAAMGLRAVSAAAGPLMLVFAGLEVVEVVADHFGKAAVNVDKLTAAVTNFATTGQASGEMANLFGKNLDNFGITAARADAATHGFTGAFNDLTTAIPGLHSALDTVEESINGMSFNSAKDSMLGLDQALVTSMGTLKDYNKASQTWQDLLTKSGLSTEQLAALLPNTYKQLGVMAAESDKAKDGLTGVAGASGAAGSGIDGVGTAAADAAKKVADLNDQFKTLFDSEMSVETATDALARKTNDLTTEFAGHTKGLTGNTTAVLDNRDKIREQLQAIENVREAQVRNHVELGVADAAYGRNIEKLKAHLVHLGFDKTAVDKLAAAYTKIPGKVDTTLSVKGVKPVAVALAALGDMQVALKTGNAPKGGWNAASGNIVKNINDPKMKAAGGPIIGPGGPRDDQIPAMLSNGEHVWTAAEVAAAGGQQAVQQMRQNVINGKPAGFALGGPVTWPYPVTAAGTHIPTKAQALAAVPAPAAGGGGSWSGVIAPGAIGEMQKWALQQVGKRYLWAAVGPDHYDCSGMVGNLWAIATNHQKYNRYMSTSDMGAGQHGMVSGPGQFTVYLSRSGGHTAANVGGLHVEAYGGNGTPNAIGHVGTRLSYYQEKLHLPGLAAGGPVDASRLLTLQDRIESFEKTGWPEPPAGLHPHRAMAGGGVITEPVVGIGASGSTYSFGERGPETVTPGLPMPTSGGGGGTTSTTVNVNVSVAPTANKADIGREIADVLRVYTQGGGRVQLRGTVT